MFHVIIIVFKYAFLDELLHYSEMATGKYIQ